MTQELSLIVAMGKGDCIFSTIEFLLILRMCILMTWVSSMFTTIFIILILCWILLSLLQRQGHLFFIIILCSIAIKSYLKFLIVIFWADTVTRCIKPRKFTLQSCQTNTTSLETITVSVSLSGGFNVLLLAEHSVNTATPPRLHSVLKVLLFIACQHLKQKIQRWAKTEADFFQNRRGVSSTESARVVTLFPTCVAVEGFLLRNIWQHSLTET